MLQFTFSIHSVFPWQQQHGVMTWSSKLSSSFCTPLLAYSHFQSCLKSSMFWSLLSPSDPYSDRSVTQLVSPGHRYIQGYGCNTCNPDGWPKHTTIQGGSCGSRKPAWYPCLAAPHLTAIQQWRWRETTTNKRQYSDFFFQHQFSWQYFLFSRENFNLTHK